MTAAYPSYLIALTRQLGEGLTDERYDALCLAAYALADAGVLTWAMTIDAAYDVLRDACFTDEGEWKGTK